MKVSLAAEEISNVSYFTTRLLSAKTVR